MEEQSRHFYDFGRFRVNVAERVLLRERDVVPLTPKVFEILLTLVQNSGQVISKDDLMKRVWPDTFVEEGNLTQNISLLRKALGEGQNGHQYIETIARRGYRFIAPVSEARDAASHAAPETAGHAFGQKAAKSNGGLQPVEPAGQPLAENVKAESSAQAGLTALPGARRWGAHRWGAHRW